MRKSRLTLVDRMTIGIPFAWLTAFLALPLVSVDTLSIRVVADSIPPVAPLISLSHGHLALHTSMRGFRTVFDDPLYIIAFWHGLANATLTALGCILIGFPIAFAIARSPARRRNLYVLLAILPFWTSFLLRAYAWMGLIRDSGPINAVLLSLGIVHQPIAILYTPTAVLLVMIYSYLPFFVLPMYAVLEKLPADLLAARPAYVFRTVTLPLSLPGIVSGAILVFVPAVGEYVIPELVGNSGTMMIGGILWDEFFQNRDWPLAAAIALVTFGLLMLPALLLRRRLGSLGTTSL